MSGVDIPLSISAGVTFCRTGENYKEILRRADEALYEKKRNGKEGCVVYEEMWFTEMPENEIPHRKQRTDTVHDIFR